MDDPVRPRAVVGQQDPAANEAHGIEDRADRLEGRREWTMQFRGGDRRVSVNRKRLEVEGRLESGTDRIGRGRVADDVRRVRALGTAIEAQVHLGAIARVLPHDARDGPFDGDVAYRTRSSEAIDLGEGPGP